MNCKKMFQGISTNLLFLLVFMIVSSCGNSNHPSPNNSDGDLQNADENANAKCTGTEKRCLDLMIQRCNDGQWVDEKNCALTDKVCQQGSCVNPDEPCVNPISYGSSGTIDQFVELYCLDADTVFYLPKIVRIRPSSGMPMLGYIQSASKTNINPHMDISFDSIVLKNKLEAWAGDHGWELRQAAVLGEQADLVVNSKYIASARKTITLNHNFSDTWSIINAELTTAGAALLDQALTNGETMPDHTFQIELDFDLDGTTFSRVIDFRIGCMKRDPDSGIVGRWTDTTECKMYWGEDF